MFSKWFEFEIIDPNGKVETTLVIGYGISESDAFVNAKGSASLVAGHRDDVAHFPTGSYRVGRGRTSAGEWH